MTKVYTLLGTPVPFKSPHFANKRVFDPRRQEKMAAGISLLQQHAGLPMYTGALAMDITFYFEPPKSFSKKKRAAMIGQPHIVKPDKDNCMKFLYDVCKGLLFSDDCIIAGGNEKKLYAYDARTEFTIRPFSELYKGQCGC